ncbi:glycosyltransferase [Candidatus Gracilibacteria bacterium]|nr:glycosyltransferase [Candidatus Gracilibacteria bacterium]
MKDKKILMIVSNLKKGGGAEDYSRVLAKSLKDLGYDIDLLTFYNFESEYDIGNIKRLSFGDIYSDNLLVKFYRFIIRYPKKIKKILDESNYNIIISNAEDVNLVTLNTKKYYSIDEKLINVVHNYLGNHPVYKHTLHHHKHSDQIITVSKYLGEIFTQKLPNTKIKSIYNPFDIDYINNQKLEQIDDDEKYLFENNTNLITVGRLSEQKNYFFLIDSLGDVLKKRENLQWLILGNGPLEKEIKNYIKQKGLQDKIKLLGVKSNPFKYIYNSDIFVFGSKNEGFGRVLAESLICGTKTISVNCPSGPSEILDNSIYSPDLVNGYQICKYGVLVEQGNKKAFKESVEYLLDNDIIFDVDEQIHKFSKEKIAQEWDYLLSN